MFAGYERTEALMFRHIGTNLTASCRTVAAWVAVMSAIKAVSSSGFVAILRCVDRF